MLIAGREVHRYAPTHVQFGLGLAAAGYLPDISSRLFSRPFEERVRTRIDTLDHGPSIAGGPQIDATVTQDARQFVSEGRMFLPGRSWIVRATWHGDIGIYWTQADDTGRIESVVEGPVAEAWTAAEELLIGLGAQGSRYLQLTVAGGRFHPNTDWPPPTIVGYGPLFPGTNQTVIASIERELRRATREMAYEAETPPQA
jgi:hypothetical protein